MSPRGSSTVLLYDEHLPLARALGRVLAQLLGVTVLYAGSRDEVLRLVVTHLVHLAVFDGAHVDLARTIATACASTRCILLVPDEGNEFEGDFILVPRLHLPEGVVAAVARAMQLRAR